MVQTIGRIRQTLIIPQSSEERFIPIQDAACRALGEAGVEIAGASALRKGFICDRGGIGVHLLLYTVAGEGELRHVPHARRLGPGDLLIAPAWTEYAYVPAAKTWRIVWFHLAEHSPWGAFCGTTPRVRRSYQTDEVHDGARHLLQESVRHDTHSHRMMALYAELLSHCIGRELRGDDSGHDRRMRQRLDRLWDTVNASLGEDWTVERLADAVSLSPSHFFQVARAFMGRTPMQVLTSLRMRRAEELLLNYDYPLKVIAERVGYSTPYAFSAAFRRHAGMSPGRFRAGRTSA